MGLHCTYKSLHLFALTVKALTNELSRDFYSCVVVHVRGNLKLISPNVKVAEPGVFSRKLNSFHSSLCYDS